MSSKLLDQSLKRTPSAVQLLVSVRNADEARVALASGVDWIDLKNPEAGPLGCPDLETAQSVARILKGHAQSSAALGELLAVDLQFATSMAELFPVLKAGLSGCAAAAIDWPELLRKISERIAPLARLVPVIYADYRLCEAPEPAAIIEQAAKLGWEWLLIDTYSKDGRNLLDFLLLDELKCLTQQAASANITLVFAGSLTLECARQLLPLEPAVIAVRGAVCENGRRSQLSKQKIDQWLRLLKPTRTLPHSAVGEQRG